jgi:hypothetical protein
MKPVDIILDKLKMSNAMDYSARNLPKDVDADIEKRHEKPKALKGISNK